EASVGGATAGGQHTESLSIGRMAISGDTRWNIQARINQDSALLRRSRLVPPPIGTFDEVGFISSVNGGEIDPNLSRAAGKVVTFAAIPLQAALAAPTLEDFAATADKIHQVDPNAFDTLQPATRMIGLDASVTRPLGEFSATLDVNGNSSRMRGLRGLPMASLVIPVGSPWSAFAEDVRLTRPLAGERALHNDNDVKSVGASLTLTGAVEGSQISLALSYLHNWTDNVLESGINVTQIQQLLDADDLRFNPYGHWDQNLLLATRSTARGDNLSARLNVQKKIADLPAGPLAWSLVADASRDRTTSEENDNAGGGSTRFDATSSQVNGQMSLAVPLSRAGQAGIGWIGGLSVDLWAGGQAMTRTRPQPRFGGGLNWSPIEGAQLSAVYEYIGTSPSFDQLKAPLVRTITRTFDYARQEVADPVWITGGNPQLQRGTRQTFLLTALLQPFSSPTLSMNLNYRQSVASGGAIGFPTLSPAIEAAFPDRVTRDSLGQLAIVDARPINIVREVDESLLAGIALRFSVSGDRSPASVSPTSVDPLQVTVSLNDNWHLKSDLLIRRDLPLIDQLGGGTGASRHLLNLQLGAGKRGIGASVSAKWTGPARVAQNGASGALSIRSPIIFDLSAFIQPDQFLAHPDHNLLMNNLNISVSIANLLNGYRHVELENGSVPLGFTHDEIDPLGRTVQFTVRKRF
ncbi:MAG: hypothetical protein ACTHKR_09030, partial [Sphingomonas sp.]